MHHQGGDPAFHGPQERSGVHRGSASLGRWNLSGGPTPLRHAVDGVEPGHGRQILRRADRVYGRHCPAPRERGIRHVEQRQGARDRRHPAGNPAGGPVPGGAGRPLGPKAGLHRRDGAPCRGPGAGSPQREHGHVGGLPVRDRPGPGRRLSHRPPGDFGKHPLGHPGPPGAGCVQLPGPRSVIGHCPCSGAAGHATQPGGVEGVLPDPSDSGGDGGVGATVPPGKQPLAGEPGPLCQRRTPPAPPAQSQRHRTAATGSSRRRPHRTCQPMARSIPRQTAAGHNPGLTTLVSPGSFHLRDRHLHAGDHCGHLRHDQQPAHGGRRHSQRPAGCQRHSPGGCGLSDWHRRGHRTCRSLGADPVADPRVRGLCRGPAAGGGRQFECHHQCARDHRRLLSVPADDQPGPQFPDLPAGR